MLLIYNELLSLIKVNKEAQSSYYIRSRKHVSMKKVYLLIFMEIIKRYLTVCLKMLQTMCRVDIGG